MSGKGDTYERRLVWMFRYAGYGAMRLAASGSGTTDDLPDVFAGSPDKLIAIEAKYRTDKEKWHYADKDEIRQVIDFSARWGVTDPLWAARFPRDTAWYFLPVSLMLTTEKSVKWRYEDVKRDWPSMDYYDLTPYKDIPKEFRSQ